MASRTSFGSTLLSGTSQHFLRLCTHRRWISSASRSTPAVGPDFRSKLTLQRLIQIIPDCDGVAALAELALNNMTLGTLAVRQDANGLWWSPMSISAKAANGALAVQMLRHTRGFRANVATLMTLFEESNGKGRVASMNQGRPLLQRRAQGYETHPELMTLLPKPQIPVSRQQFLPQQSRRHRQNHDEAADPICLSLLVTLQYRMMKDHRGPNGTWEVRCADCALATESLSVAL